MNSFVLEDRHVLVNFILQGTVTNMEGSVVSQLRECLHLEQSRLSTQIATAQRGRFSQSTRLNPNTSTENDVALIIDAIRISMTKDKRMGDAWFRAIEAAGRVYSVNNKDGMEKHKPLDFFILLLLYGLANRKKQVESLLKNKTKRKKANCLHHAPPENLPVASNLPFRWTLLLGR